MDGVMDETWRSTRQADRLTRRAQQLPDSRARYPSRPAASSAERDERRGNVFLCELFNVLNGREEILPACRRLKPNQKVSIKQCLDGIRTTSGTNSRSSNRVWPGARLGTHLQQQA